MTRDAMLDGNEQVVLSALMNGTSQLPVAAEDFFSPPNRIIFKCITGLTNRSLLPVTEALCKNGELESVGGACRITEIYNMPHDRACLDYALNCMLEASRKRRAAEIGAKLHKGDITPEEAAELLLKLNQKRGAERNWSEALNESVVVSSELHDLDLKPRKKLLGDWFCEGDLGFIFAFRGVGKTWLALAIAQALSTGGKLGEWQGHEATKVLYIDGEMPPDLMRDRCDGLQSCNDQLQFLNHEILFERTGKVLNIADPEIQNGITKHCVNTGVKVLFIDNLSTAAFGLKENEADSWEKMLPWLLDLRRRKIAVVIVHHAGRSGEMRGTSKREDSVFWIIALDDMKKNAEDKRGARFISRFTKPSRNTQDDVPAYDWHFVTESNGTVTISHKQAHALDVFRRAIEDGITECSQIAQEMKVSPATVSRFAKKAIDAKWLRKKGRNYELIETETEADK